METGKALNSSILPGFVKYYEKKYTIAPKKGSNVGKHAIYVSLTDRKGACETHIFNIVVKEKGGNKEG